MMKTRHRKVVLFLFLVFWSVPESFHAQSWDTLVRPASGTVSRRPSITVSEGMIHLVYIQTVGSPAVDEIVYKNAPHPGSAWPATETKISTCTQDGYLTGICKAGNTIHVVWSEEGIGAGSHNVYYSRSTDGGNSFSAKQALNQSAGDGSSPVMAVSENTVHVAWIDYRGSSVETYYRRSTDSGVTWDTETRLTNTPGLCERGPKIAADGQHVYVVFRADSARIGTDMEIHFILTSDGGKTWGTPHAITQSKVSKWDPDIAAADGKIHVVYCTVGGPLPRDAIKYLRNDNRGLCPWTDPVAVHRSFVYIGHPSLSAYQDKLFLAWLDGRGGSDEYCDLYCMTASQYGESWSEEQALYQSHMQDSWMVSTVIDGSELYAAWYEEQFDEAVFRHGTLPATTYHYNFSGHVYKGVPPDKSVSLPGVTLELWGDDNDNPEDSPGDLLVSETANSVGDFFLHSGSMTQPYNYYHIIEIDPDGYISTGAEAGDPAAVVTHESCITYTGSAMTVGTTYENNYFWDKASGLSPCTFQGQVYEGTDPDKDHPLADVNLEVWGDDDADPENGMTSLIDACTTGGDGAYSLTVDELHAAYHIVTLDKAGFEHAGAAANPPCHVHSDHIVKAIALDLTPGATYDEINFWYLPVTWVDPDWNLRPNAFCLYPNHPNPFNPSTRITFSLPQRSRITLEIYTVQGKRIRTLAAGMEEAGVHSMTWDGTDDRGRIVQSGLYLCRMKAPSYQTTIRMLFLK